MTAAASGDGLVIFTPLATPGLFADGLLAALASQRFCTVVTEDGPAERPTQAGIRAIPMSAYRRVAAEYRESPHLYDLAASADHVYMLPALSDRPGVVMLPGPNLHRLLEHATLERGDTAAYTSALATEYGGPGRVLPRGSQTEVWRGLRMRQDMPMLAGLIGPARGVIVHSQYAAAKVLASVPDAEVSIIPYPWLAAQSDGTAGASPPFRERLGIGAEELLFVSLGAVSPDKCLDRVLLALAGTVNELPPFHYVIAGELRPGGPDLREMASRLGLGSRIVTIGCLPPDRLQDLLVAADVLIHLRAPPDGRSSATLTQGLGAGACTVVIDRGPPSELPDGSVEKIAWGPGFDRRLGQVLLRLARDPAARRAMGIKAARLTAGRHRLGQVVPQMLQAIDAAESRPHRLWRTPAQWTFAPGAFPRPRTGRLWQRCLALPRLSLDLQAVRFSETADPDGWLWRTQPLSALTKPLPARDVDLILVDAAAERLVLHTADKLRRLNGMLRFGGMLVINITRSEDGLRGMLETHSEGANLLECCGFTLDQHATAPEPDLLESPHHPLCEESCWRAIKVREFFSRVDWPALL